jgi:hypothetical protein
VSSKLVFVSSCRPRADFSVVLMASLLSSLALSIMES